MSDLSKWALASASGLLPAIGTALLLAAVISGGAGLWIGKEWQAGRTAKAERKALQDDIQRWVDVAVEQREAAVELAGASRAAAFRMDAIALQREQDREQLQQHFDRQRAALDALLRQRPDLRSDDLGPDVLCHWNTSKAGADTDAAATAAIPGCEPAAAVPATADGDQRDSRGADRRSRPHHGHVSRLRQQAGQADPGAGRMGAHRMGLVLQRGGAAGAQGGRLRVTHG